MKFVPSRAEDVSMVACERLAEIKYYSQVSMLVVTRPIASLFYKPKKNIKATVFLLYSGRRAVSGN